jgi:hypothetical protein
MDPVAMLALMPVKHLCERLGADRRGLGCLFGERAPATVPSSGWPRRRTRERGNEIGQHLGFTQQTWWQLHGKGAFDPEQQLRTRETVETPVAL